MRLPDFEEGLLTAALVLEVERNEVEGMIRAERLHQALLGPAAHVDGCPLFTADPEIVKLLLVKCAHGRILPTTEGDFRLGWLLVQRTIELSECKWRPSRGHQARLEEFRQQLLEGIDPGEPLEQWLREGIHPPHRSAAEAGTEEELRSILVSSPMHPAPELDVRAWANAVDAEVERFFEQNSDGEGPFTWRPQVFPIEASSDEELLRTIEWQIHTADGLVVLAPHCSWGVAFELEAGLRAMVPTLFIHTGDAPPSSGARSRLETMGATVYALHCDPESAEVVTEVANLVSRWLEKSSSLILETKRRRHCLEQRYAPLIAAIRIRRTQMTTLEERHALAAAGIDPARAQCILEECWGLISASFPEVVHLANAYGVRTNVDWIVPEPVSDRPPYLTPAEESALEVFVARAELSPEDSIHLAVAGQREIAAPGPGRHRRVLTDWTKWKGVWERLKGEG